MSDPDYFIELYIKDRRSFSGRYVAADLFKETFWQYRESRESRNRYNAPVHNSAAVLSAEQFRRMLKYTKRHERDVAVFLTGIPGAGKTSSVLSGGELPSHYRVIFEGQLSNFDTTTEKLKQAIAANLKPLIIVVHALPENALKNTIKRFNEEGRGASINVMSAIQGGLPDSLAEMHRLLGNKVSLIVQDNRDISNPQTMMGWKYLSILLSEGNHEQIKQRLSRTIEQLYTTGTISALCYQQAIGGAPIG
jgi:Zeta toxin